MCFNQLVCGLSGSMLISHMHLMNINDDLRRYHVYEVFLEDLLDTTYKKQD